MIFLNASILALKCTQPLIYLSTFKNLSKYYFLDLFLYAKSVFPPSITFKYQKIMYKTFIVALQPLLQIKCPLFSANQLMTRHSEKPAKFQIYDVITYYRLWRPRTYLTKRVTLQFQFSHVLHPNN